MGYNYGYYDTGYSQPQFGFSYESYDRGGYPREGYYMDRPHIPRPLRRAFESLETPLLGRGYDYPAYMPRHGRRFCNEPEPFWGHSRGNSFGIDYDGESIGLSFLGRYSHSRFGLNLRLPLNNEPEQEQGPPPPPRHEVTLQLTPKAPVPAPVVTQVAPPPVEKPKGKLPSGGTSEPVKHVIHHTKKHTAPKKVSGDCQVNLQQAEKIKQLEEQVKALNEKLNSQKPKSANPAPVIKSEAAIAPVATSNVTKKVVAGQITDTFIRTGGY